jgi:hypothetical protein
MNVQVFDQSGTFIVPDGIEFITVELWGGGGGYGSAIIPGYNSITSSCGGGGGYGKQTFAVTSGTQFTVHVGAGGALNGGNGPFNKSVGGPGGTSSFGNLISATGGQGGASNILGNNPTGIAYGGSSTATINMQGGAGLNNGGNAGGGGGQGGIDYITEPTIPGGGSGEFTAIYSGFNSTGNGARGRVIVHY